MMIKYLLIGFCILLFQERGYSKEQYWINKSLSDDIFRYDIKTMNNYLFFGILFDDSENQWHCLYDNDYKPIEIEEKNDKKHLRAAFVNYMYSSGKTSGKLEIADIEITFSRDSNIITLNTPNLNQPIIFEKHPFDNFQGIYLRNYYLKKLYEGSYKNLFDDRTILEIRFDNLSLKNDSIFNATLNSNFIEVLINEMHENRKYIISRFVYNNRICSLVYLKGKCVLTILEENKLFLFEKTIIN